MPELTKLEFMTLELVKSVLSNPSRPHDNTDLSDVVATCRYTAELIVDTQEDSGGLKVINEDNS